MRGYNITERLRDESKPGLLVEGAVLDAPNSVVVVYVESCGGEKVVFRAGIGGGCTGSAGAS